MIAFFVIAILFGFLFIPSRYLILAWQPQPDAYGSKR